MKFLVPLFALLVAGQSAFALTPSNFVGTWTGVRLKTFKGKTEEQPTTTNLRKFDGSGLVEHATVKTSSGITRTLIKYFKDGSLESSSIQKGQVSGLSSGYWYFRKNTLYYRTYSNDGKRRTGSIRLRLLSPSSFLYTAVYSDGVKVTARFVKR